MGGVLELVLITNSIITMERKGWEKEGAGYAIFGYPYNNVRYDRIMGLRRLAVFATGVLWDRRRWNEYDAMQGLYGGF